MSVEQILTETERGPEQLPDWRLPRYHVTDALWGSFTIEGVNKSIEALRKHGELRHPEAFTVRVSSKALWDTAPGFFEAAAVEVERRSGLETSRPRDNDGETQDFYDFHHWGHENGSITGRYIMTQTMRLHRPNIPLAQRAAFLRQCQEDVDERMRALGRPEGAIILRQWWERNWACMEYSVAGSEFEAWRSTGIPKLTAWILIVCLRERAVRKVVVEPPTAPKSHIARRLAARRGDQPDATPETVLYVPARIYEGSKNTHASPHLHYRSPHWRKQPYGPRSDPTYKDVWIEGMFINAVDCTEAEKSEVRIRARNFRLLGA